MRSQQVLYVAQKTSRAETVGVRFAEELSVHSVTTTTTEGAVTTHDSSAVDCLVYEMLESAVPPEKIRKQAYSDESATAVLFVVSSDSDVSVNTICGLARTDLVRTDAPTEDIELIAHRVTQLLDTFQHDNELTRAQQRFETLFENLTQPTVEVEFDGKTPLVQRVNRAFEEIFGYTESEMRDESLDEFVVPPDRYDEAADINERVHSGEVFTIEVTRQTADGPQEFLLQNAVYPDSSREFAMYTDITERKQRERKLRQQNERLDEFARIVAHDLQNPLSVATGRLELARAEHESEHLAKASNALDRMNALIDDLLTLARQSESITDPEWIPLAPTAEEAWETVETREATLITATNWQVEADRTRLRQLFENLFANAVDHGGKSVTVTVGCTDNADGFYVEDDGSGIPEDERPEVLEAGYSTADDGTGFGLYIVHQAAEAHGWDIRITGASDGGGARFEFTNVEISG